MPSFRISMALEDFNDLQDQLENKEETITQLRGYISDQEEGTEHAARFLAMIREKMGRQEFTRLVGEFNDTDSPATIELNDDGSVNLIIDADTEESTN